MRLHLFPIVFSLLFYACSEKADNNTELHTQTNTKPNFIVILLDDIGWNGTSTMMDTTIPSSKSDFYQTPNISSIIEGGMRFSNGYASAPICSPTRYAIQFGQSPARLNKTDVVWSGTKHIDHEGMLTLPKMIKNVDSKYTTAHFGKWHIDVLPSVMGYDESDGWTTNREGFFAGSINGKHEHDTAFILNDGKMSNALSLRAADYVERKTKAGEPFFMQVSYYANHTFACSSPEQFEKYSSLTPGKVHDNPYYAGMTADLDNGIGLLLEKIKELKIDDNTYIFLVSDNGAIPQFPPLLSTDTSFNYPLSWGKWRCFEGGVRIPFAVKGPGINAGTQSNQLVVTHDLLPTIKELMGNNDLLPETIDGKSFAKSFEGHECDRKIIVEHLPKVHGWPMFIPETTLRKGNYKLHKNWQTQKTTLYDLSNDLGENIDIYNEKTEIAMGLSKELAKYLVSVNADTNLLTGPINK